MLISTYSEEIWNYFNLSFYKSITIIYEYSQFPDSNVKSFYVDIKIYKVKDDLHKGYCLNTHFVYGVYFVLCWICTPSGIYN